MSWDFQSHLSCALPLGYSSQRIPTQYDTLDLSNYQLVCCIYDQFLGNLVKNWVQLSRTKKRRN